MKFGSQMLQRTLRRFCSLTGRSPDPALETLAAAGALEESWFSDYNLAAPSPPRAGETWMLQVTARIKMQ